MQITRIPSFLCSSWRSIFSCVNVQANGCQWPVVIIATECNTFCSHQMHRIASLRQGTPTIPINDIIHFYHRPREQRWRRQKYSTRTLPATTELVVQVSQTHTTKQSKVNASFAPFCHQLSTQSRSLWTLGSRVSECEWLTCARIHSCSGTLGHWLAYHQNQFSKLCWANAREGAKQNYPPCDVAKCSTINQRVPALPLLPTTSPNHPQRAYIDQDQPGIFCLCVCVRFGAKLINDKPRVIHRQRARREQSSSQNPWTNSREPLLLWLFKLITVKVPRQDWTTDSSRSWC